PVSLPLKPKLDGKGVLGSAGPLEIEVSGGVVSTVQLAVAGVGSALPALSVARTRKPWLPSARPLYACGLVQAVKAAPSRLHWKPARPLPVSLPLKPK